ncbi:MAG: 16S rRNA (cytosine(967)-C(5))-methyltransferase RsmB [Deltaproteobacteria bacterium]|nr:16S rRNA (cytosine(967)-C(5))-methyltransferase RsmB [Deltaproteobacteria bacterium]
MSPKTPSARELAVKILAEAEARDRSVEDLLAAALKRHPGLIRVERAFLLELVQGVKRWQIKLDYFISRISRLPLAKLHPLALIILRVGAYQLIFLDKVPDHAAVSEMVNLAKAMRLPRQHVGYINALLRRLAEEGPGPLPPVEADRVRGLSLATAHPEWLVKRWLKRYGPRETLARLNANNQIPPLTIRANTLKTDRAALQVRLQKEGVRTEACRFSPAGLQIISLESPPQSLPSYREGLWLFQDEAAQLAGYLLPLIPGQRVLEIGAGRGGKTTHLAERLQNQGYIVSVDYHRRRLKELSLTAGRWGAAVVQPLLADASQPLPFQEQSFDAVVIDAPCSALGIIRRHPEIKTRLEEADLATFPPRQRAMLAQAAPLLRTGGHLLYITCTTEPAENEKLIAGFLKRHPDFRLVFDPSLLPAPARLFMLSPGYFRTSPIDDNLDGFYAALLAKA